MNYPCFTTGINLLEKLLERYRVPNTFDEVTKNKIQEKVCDVIDYWKSMGQVLVTRANQQINVLDEIDIEIQNDKKTLNLGNQFTVTITND